jgi:hypothetical protein
MSRPLAGKVSIGYWMVAVPVLVIVMVLSADRVPESSGRPYVMSVAVTVNGGAAAGVAKAA